ncbi:acyl-CoA synthetases /AMP-acid ligases II [Aspergillus sclerotioniger CBS 115572]|uniref:Acyl-CoA synthetases /AMP-acid ligases II n=1 Tax=Aspergillus sclerotioniger CBS 115572 TaxID=1450535 RepID=A0A317X7E0_9EURO|nr:acyl-CoA synthetases /AMP-acid ligases II [Aspergillus sclerotioniger CBS 115572]PWY93467.1 acyl-CoA synthetases /AMP-acid ligases II [Aspergillus sclerotioniger CBS 115572]
MQEASSSLSITHGPSEPALIPFSIGQLLDHQAAKYPTHEAVVFPTEGIRYTYHELSHRVQTVSKALLAHGISAGDRIGVFSGNCAQYVEVFLAVTRIGAITVLLNTAYSSIECQNVLKETAGCSMLFTSSHIGQRGLASNIGDIRLLMEKNKLPDLKEIVLLQSHGPPSEYRLYEDFLNQASRRPEIGLSEEVDSDQTCTFQFTSGTTGAPKIAMLTHRNVINNGNLIGHRLQLTPEDVVCCPYPLFHIFGLVIGLLSCLTHGATVVYPSPTFDPAAVLQSIVQESCTGLHGVPTIFIALLERYHHLNLDSIHIRTGLIGGAPIPAALIKDVQRAFGFEDLTVAYGTTETSPISFMSRASDQPDDGVVIHNALLPHTSAKIVDLEGKVVPRGVRGELCIAGYLVQEGYHENPTKTAEALRPDASGIVWMHSGDEALVNEDGHCLITGRIKDIIIRGAENIYPAEIEERLNEHPAISQACVVGVQHRLLGEEVAAILQPALDQPRPSRQTIIDWVQTTLGTQKAPSWIFWLGDDGNPKAFPITESGKIKRIEVADLSNQLLAKKMPSGYMGPSGLMDPTTRPPWTTEPEKRNKFCLLS